MYYLSEKFGYEHRGLVISDEHIYNIIRQKNIYEEVNNVIEAHEDYFWHVVNCEQLIFSTNHMGRSNYDFQTDHRKGFSMNK